MKRNGTVLKGALLVAGTAIGGGILAMPVLTSLGGFIPSLFLFLFCWLFMAGTGLLMLEVCFWMEGDTNMVSMAEKTLGSWGMAAAWVLYLFLFFTLTLAYVVGCGEMTAEVVGSFIPSWAGPSFFVILFSPLVYVGARLIGRVNEIFMAGLILTYFILIYLGFSHVNAENLKHVNWSLSLRTLPVAFTAFAYQGIVPTLSRYLDFNRQKARRAILWGSFVPFVAYVFWHWLIMGIVPAEGPGGLYEALAKGSNAIVPLKNAVNNPWITIVGNFFAFFALVTSFLGVTLGLRDFLADGFHLKKTPTVRFLICGFIFVPVLIAAYAFPGIFLEALGFAGGYGCALLLGLLPILMVWSGRYKMKLPGQQLVPGGKTVLVIMTIFVTVQVLLQTLHLLGKY